MELHDIRHLPEIQAIAEYLRNMEFKRKLIGGVSADDVLSHFSIITLQYEAVISACMAQSEEYVQQNTGLRSRISQLERDNAAWDQYCQDLKRWYEKNAAQQKAHNDQMQQQAMAQWAAMEQRKWADGHAP